MRGLFLCAALLLAATASAADLSLDEALRRAAQENLDLVQARARLTQAHANTRKAWAGYLPHLSVGGSYTRNSTAAEISLPTGYHIRDVGQPTSAPFDPSREAGIGNPPGMPTTLLMVPAELQTVTIQRLNQLGAQAELRQAIFAPTLWATIVAAGKAEQMAELRYVHGRRELLFGVAQAWFGAAGLRETISVQEALLQTTQAQVENARVRVQAGASPKIDLLRAELDLARAEQDLIRTQNAYLSAKSSLATLLGAEPDFEVPPSGSLPELPEAPSQQDAEGRIGERADVQAAQVQLELAEASTKAAFAAYLPTIGLTGQYRVSNTAGFTGEYDTWAVIVGLNWVLWDGGVREAQVREARAVRIEAEAGMKAAELRARDEIRRGRLELDSARANQEKARKQVALARENLQLVRTAWEAGGATSLDVSNAQAALTGAELSLLGERVSAHLATLQVLKAAGALDVKP